MVFSSVSFLFAFLPAILFTYFFISHSRIQKNYILLLFSLAFYCWGGLRLLPLIAYSVFTNYYFGRKVSSSQRKKLWLVFAIISNLGLLFCFKYVGFLAENLKLFIPSVPTINIVLPIGISFYTFQGLSYVIDVYRDDAKCESSIANVALYIVLFPQLIAGPIVRYSTIAAEIHNRKESISEVSQGLQRFLYGLSKKVLIANQVGQLADDVFKQNEPLLSTGLVVLGILAYSAQIYFDFSGYSDMAIGLGRIFGFHFLENFNYPYISKSITEFWRRWHISLSSWFRDYLYIPLGGNRGNNAKHIRNLLLVWGLTGIWHGAAWNFVIWGLYYGLLLILEKYLIGKLLSKIPRPLQHIYTLILVFIGWLIFRANDLSQLKIFLNALLGNAQDGLWNYQATYLFLQYRWDLLLAGLLSLPVYHKIKLKLQNSTSHFAALLLTWGEPLFTILLGLLSVMRLLASGFNPFIYFQF